ncbi:MAG: hypothetical protein JXN61_04490 [Sedimentisphaerales bacterium]|nr:hypothetical protein [Sedimentisphaerales bacterium]
MCEKRISLVVSVLILGLLIAGNAFGTVIDRRIDNDDDDAEQIVGGAADTTSSDLELPYEEPNQVNLQVAGMRFRDIPVPQGAPIVSAYIQFQVDETKAGDQPVNLIIDGELALDAQDFASWAEIEDRPRTSARVSWSVPNWTTANQQGADQRSGDLTAIIREIVNQPSWVPGNAIVLIISDDPANPSQGVRCAEAHDGSTSGAPMLHIEYLTAWASQPQPADGQFINSLSVLLSWARGDYRWASHVYFGDNRANVEAGTGGTDKGLTYRNTYPLAGLLPETTYYWKIDEVNNTHPDSPWVGEIWSFTTMSDKATNPDPADGAVNVLKNVTLSWDAGMDMDHQNIFIGTNYNTVLNATTPTANTTATSWDPNGLVVNGQTYYWRIDTYDTSAGSHKGPVWSFSTMPAIPIDDPNLIGWWTFEEQSGSYAIDRSGHDNVGIFVGDPQRLAGYDGKALDLDGDDFMRIDDVADDVTSSNVTLSAWVKTTVANSDWYACNEATGSGNVLIFAIVGGQPAVLDANNAYEGLPTTAVNDGLWHMLTYVCDGATGYIYVDGVLRNTHEAQINFSPDDRWSLGQEWDSATPTEFLTGTIDDVRLYNKPLTEIEIRDVMRINADRAWNPSPQQGATPTLGEFLRLEWSSGEGATRHDVYFGTNPQAVASADTVNTLAVYKGRRITPNFDPGDLELGTTYFWRIDEVKSDLSITKGVLWSFKIEDFLVVDDFESYVAWGLPGDQVYEIWRDAFGDCSPGNGNSTGAVLTENPDPPGPAMDGQSVKYDFDNDGMIYNLCTSSQAPVTNLYSRIEAQTANLPSGIGSDWTVTGAKALSMRFYGRPGNAMTEVLWTQLRDAGGYGQKVFYGDFAGESLQDFNEASWHDWDIDLADFEVDLAHVVSIVIGIGQEGSASPGGMGTLYFDDIRLYAPRFMPEHLTPRPTDYVFDGIVDYLDLTVMIEDWLMTDYSADPLIAWYKLDGNADDSSANAFHGTLMNNPTFAAGAGDIGMAIDCNDADDDQYVDTDVNAVDMGLAGRAPRTITSWVSVRSFNSAGVYEMGTDSDGREFVLRVRSSVGQWQARYGGNVYHTITGLDTRGDWTHFAQVYTGGHSHVYVNGELRSSMAVRLDTGTDKEFHIARWNNNYFDGLIDDVRIYNKALTEAEIASVMAGGTAVAQYHPVPSPMNLTDPEAAGSRAVNFADFAVFMDEWAQKQFWP